MEYYDLITINDIVTKLEQDNGRLRTLVHAVINSAPFQMQRSKSVQQAGADTLKPQP